MLISSTVPAKSVFAFISIMNKHSSHVRCTITNHYWSSLVNLEVLVSKPEKKTINHPKYSQAIIQSSHVQSRSQVGPTELLFLLFTSSWIDCPIIISSSLATLSNTMPAFFIAIASNFSTVYLQSLFLHL